MDNLLKIANGERIKRSDIPSLPFHVFRQELLQFAVNGGQIVHYFAYEDAGVLMVLAIVRSDAALYAAAAEAPEAYHALTADCEKFHMFEREIAEQYGVRPYEHPWLKHVRYHANYRQREDVFGNDYRQDIPGNYDYFPVEGEAIHEVAVGPVHAGIIEPGHFRFQCIGEEVLHLEIQLGYQHRGVEKMLTAVPRKRLPVIVEGIAGDTAIGHSLCYAQAIESLGSLPVDEGASIVRAIALELERIANHIGDLGALSGDVAFNPPAAYFGRLRGEFLNLLLVLSGNRFGKGLVRPGGVAYTMGQEQRRILIDKIKETKLEIAHVCDLLFTAHTVQARFDHTGTVDRETAEKLGLVGYAGRASGIAYDARVSFPTECYAGLPASINNKTDGDVASRAAVRREEVEHSFLLIETLLAREVATESVLAGDCKLAPSSLVVTINEGWRGEVSHCLLTDAQGEILRYKIKDPSFHNWTGLAMALRHQGISDFPLCNKSFNLSYCGFDL
ncbi:MAG: hydrogenase [Desulfurivibrio sp.]|nr:MAG: hydrogenase [Desulfurivibrio sp.]